MQQKTQMEMGKLQLQTAKGKMESEDLKDLKGLKELPEHLDNLDCNQHSQ